MCFISFFFAVWLTLLPHQEKKYSFEQISVPLNEENKYKSEIENEKK